MKMKRFFKIFSIVLAAMLVYMLNSCTVVSPQPVGTTTRYVVYDNYYSGPYYRPYVAPPVYYRPAPPKGPYNGNYRPHKPVGKPNPPAHRPGNNRPPQHKPNNHRR